MAGADFGFVLGNPHPHDVDSRVAAVVVDLIATGREVPSTWVGRALAGRRRAAS